MFRIARKMGGLLGIEVNKLSFSITDMRDPNGFSLRLKVAYQELAKVQSAIENDDKFKNFINRLNPHDRLIDYLHKELCFYDPLGVEGYQYIWNALILIQVFMWISERAKNDNKKIFLFLERRLWWNIIEGYTADLGASLIALPRKIGRKAALKTTIRPWIRGFIFSIFNMFSPQQKGKISRLPQIAIVYYGHLNLERPSLYCDLFFMHPSKIHGTDISLIFDNRKAPLDRRINAEIQKYGINPIVLNFFANKVRGVVTHKSVIKMDHNKIKKQANCSEEAWLHAEVTKYKRLRAYWRDIFEQHDIKVFMHWYKYDAEHMAIADAIRSVGGVMAIYQRSLEVQPTSETTLSVDIEFGFSIEHVELERRSKSNILYHVTTGYFNDHRFRLLIDQAENIRESLQRQGVKYTVAFFDENTVDDARWFTGHEFTQKNYAFLLDKVLANPCFGLIIKPKQPSTLRSRLGPVKKLLDDALATNRCYLFTEGVLQNSYPPALASLAADISIHDSLSAGTAGLESALYGTPTLLMDFEGWPGNRLYELGVGRVVFTEWESAWEACQNYFCSKKCVDGFGDWSSIINDLDPFRDGRAAERIGTYLKWLLDGFKAGLNRETVMADAAERYCRQWGYDKITSIP